MREAQRENKKLWLVNLTMSLVKYANKLYLVAKRTAFCFPKVYKVHINQCVNKLACSL